MQLDIFKEILVPVIGGLGIFMLGLEFMSDGINNLAANRMRVLLAKIAGTPVKGLFAGTLITGVLQSSTAMTVMVVGLVNAGVVGLRPAISIIMGANIGTTLGNGLIALPLGPLGLILGGLFALVYVFSKVEKTKNIAMALMGFALIFYGLNLLTSGLKPLRAMPEMMSAIVALKADSFVGLISCVLTAAGITALIHSSSATIGIVMGLGAAGVLNWYTAVAFSLGADLGTTITSWMASLNLSKNAKRAAYAHIAFNFLGVALMLPLFFLSMELLQWVMGFFGGDPGQAVMDANGKETFPLVPVAVAVNIEGQAAAELRLSPDLLADIFLGRVKTWADPTIAQLNPGLKLPAAPIAVVHRADGSGTTYTFTAFLAQSSADWKSQIGSDLLVNWPVGEGYKGSSGVARALQRTPNSVGYLDLVQALAAKLQVASVQIQRAFCRA